MRIRRNSKFRSVWPLHAFSIPEVLVAVAVIGITFVSLYSALSSGFVVVQLARENLRAIQILQEKMETIRLYTWTQINTSGFIPPQFVETFYPNTNGNPGLNYTGTVTIASTALSGEAYSPDVKEVTVELRWKSAKVLRTRTMKTFVSRYGLQQYIYW